MLSISVSSISRNRPRPSLTVLLRYSKSLSFCKQKQHLFTTCLPHLSVCLSVINISLAALLAHCSVCLDNYTAWHVCRIEELRMTLLGLPDAEHVGSTILPNLDTIYKWTLYSVPKDLNFEPDIELCIHEILCLQ